MEKYRLHGLIGKGPHSEVYCAETKGETNQQWALKRIECNNQTEAIKALKELEIVQKLDHPNISAPKDVFIQWDANLSAVFLGIVMPHQKDSLQEVIDVRRAAEVPLDESQVKGWLRQMISSLAYSESMSVYHMNIKPCNIFLDNNQTIQIGDFSGKTILTESRNFKCRMSANRYMPPEGIETFNVKADVWGIGCVLLELMTCSFLSQSEFATFLSEFKEDDSPIAIHQSFVNLLERTSELYSRELINIAKMMLVVDPKSRCSLKQLLEIHEISNYLSTPGPLAAENQEPEETQHRSCKTYDEDPDVNAVIAEMKSHVESPLQLVQGIWKLNHLIGTPTLFDEDAKTLIGHLMRKHKRNADFSIAACTFLANLARQSAEEDLEFIRSLISTVSEAMKCFPECYKLQIAGAIIFKYVSMNKDAAAEIGAIGGVQDNISALKNFPDNIEVCLFYH